MLQGVPEIVAVCVGVLGLIGAAAATGMPMWRVTAFIGENIIVMETRWEGLWMNCYRQANIRMQCKVYDSLLALPPDLQAARGLMCCSLALGGLGLLVALAGLRCTSCVRDNDRAKAIILTTVGGMQLMASLCVLIPVSWTGHVIIRDFYNPLLIDAQRRELGEALYIGWVSAAFLFASGVLFACRRVPSDKEYPPAWGQQRRPVPYDPTPTQYRPVSAVRAAPPSQAPPPQLLPLQSYGGPLLYPSSGGRHDQPLFQTSTGPPTSTQSSNYVGSLLTPGSSLYVSRQGVPYALRSTGHPSTSHYSGYSFQPVPQNPVFITYKASRLEPESYYSGSSSGVYI